MEHIAHLSPSPHTWGDVGGPAIGFQDDRLRPRCLFILPAIDQTYATPLGLQALHVSAHTHASLRVLLFYRRIATSESSPPRPIHRGKTIGRSELQVIKNAGLESSHDARSPGRAHYPQKNRDRKSVGNHGASLLQPRASARGPVPLTAPGRQPGDLCLL